MAVTVIQIGRVMTGIGRARGWNGREMLLALPAAIGEAISPGSATETPGEADRRALIDAFHPAFPSSPRPTA
jgi:hypothetical protein